MSIGVWWWKPYSLQVFSFWANFSSCAIHAGQFNVRISRSLPPAGSYRPKNAAYSPFTQSWWLSSSSSSPSSSNIKVTTVVLFLNQSRLSFKHGSNKIILNDSCPRTRILSHTHTHTRFFLLIAICILQISIFLNWLALWQPKEGGHHGLFWFPSEGENNQKALAYWRSILLTGLF